MTESDMKLKLLEKKYEILVDEKTKLENECVKLKEELRLHKDEIVKYLEWYHTISNSSMWKITKPLRIINDFKKNRAGNK